MPYHRQSSLLDLKLQCVGQRVSACPTPDVHEDTCLLENPLYWDWEVDCTLCQRVGVVTLPHADDFERLFYHKGVPVVVQVRPELRLLALGCGAFQISKNSVRALQKTMRLGSTVNKKIKLEGPGKFQCVFR